MATVCPPQLWREIDASGCLSDQLTKVNAVTLMSWLKNKGISCRSKDKKTDLVDKVLQALCLSVSEP